jgi:hypothetical protein
MVNQARINVIASAALLLAASWPAIAGATIPTNNLLVNPGAEAGRSGHGGKIPIPGWTVSAQISEYNPGTFSVDDYGDVDRPSRTVSAAIGGGRNYFFGGPDNRASKAVQVVNVSMAGTEIDANQVRVVLGGYLGGYAHQQDDMVVDAKFLDASGNPLAGSIALNGPGPAERNNHTQLVPRVAFSIVPAGTRSIQVTLTASRFEGNNNDGYADNLYLLLSAQTPQGAAAALKTLPFAIAVGLYYGLPAADRAPALVRLSTSLAARFRVAPAPNTPPCGIKLRPM